MDPSDDQILEAVREILKDADLNTISTKKVRGMLEERFGVDLAERKKRISNITLDVVEEINRAQDEAEEEAAEEGSAQESQEDEDDGVVDAKPKASAKRKSKTEAISPAKRPRKAAPASSARGASAVKPKKRAKKEDNGEEDGDSKGKRSGGAYSAMLSLSPELADVLGEPQMRRSDVVKRMWAVIRERNLKDPKDGRFHINDEQLVKVFGVKRVQTFGMMKYLKKHLVPA